MDTRTHTTIPAQVLVTKRYVNYGGRILSSILSSPPSSAQPAMSSPLSLLPLLPLAIENRHIIYAERYLSGALRVFLSILLHDAKPGPQVSHYRSSYMIIC